MSDQIVTVSDAVPATRKERLLAAILATILAATLATGGKS